MLPLGLLVYRSDFLPRLTGRVIGVWLILNCFAYVTISYTGLFHPRYEQTVFNALFPLECGELALMLWLLIKGADMQKWQAREAASVGA